MTNVVNLAGMPVPAHGEPNQPLVDMLTDLLDHARAGRLQSFIGTGFCADGGRLSVWADGQQPDVYAMLGSLTWLEHEYVKRHSYDVETGLPNDGA